ncbi:MAG: PCRF domain-containing protein, partial [Spirochaetales bacterium]|nr:PCRF domain-containing protein [Spirochaetales bacterium]
MEAPGFWDVPERSNKLMKELKNLKDVRQTCLDLGTQYDDILTLIEIGYEENDPDLVAEIAQELASFEEVFEEIRIGTLLAGE